MAVILWQGDVHTRGPGLLGSSSEISEATNNIGEKISGDRNTVDLPPRP